MKSRTVTVNEGENLGPVDWTYDFTQHDWSKSGGGVNPSVTVRGKEMLQEIEAALNDGKTVEACTYTVFQPVIDIGMYDGWPFWKPTPSYMVRGPLGGEWHPYYALMGVRIVPTVESGQ